MKSSSLQPLEYFKNLFQFDNAEIEKDVPLRPDFYPGLDPAALYTDLVDLYALMTHDLAQGCWLDLGCGTGVGPLMYAALYPDRKSFGIEAASSRLRAGQVIQERLGLVNASLIHGDLLNCAIPIAETYFLYFPTGHVLDRVLSELASFKHPLSIVAIESHGDLLPRLRKEGWLNEISTTKLSAARHHPEAIWFESNHSPREQQGAHYLSFKQQALVIRDGNSEEWLAESFGLNWSHDNIFDLLTPPRSIDWQQVISVRDESALSRELSFLYHLRPLGEVSLSARGTSYSGTIRKIIISPTFSVELSTGQKLKWQEIQSIHWDQFLCYESSSAYFCLPPVHK